MPNLLYGDGEGEIFPKVLSVSFALSELLMSVVFCPCPPTCKKKNLLHIMFNYLFISEKCWNFKYVLGIDVLYKPENTGEMKDDDSSVSVPCVAWVTLAADVPPESFNIFYFSDYT